jgi:DNA-binding response OmpR family regulator
VGKQSVTHTREDFLMARILVVDNDELVLTLNKTILDREGHEVLTAGSGIQALRILVLEERVANPIDLVLTDLDMPEMDGFELAREVRVHRVEHIKKVLILMLTGNTSSETQRLAIMAGVDLVIPKPCGNDYLIAAVNRLLGR